MNEAQKKAKAAIKPLLDLVELQLIQAYLQGNIDGMLEAKQIYHPASETGKPSR